MMAHYVTHGYVTVPTAVDGGVAHVDIRRGAVLPGDVPEEYVAALLARGHIAKHEAVEPAEVAEPEVDSEEVPGGTAVEVLAWVGDNAGRAARALEVEQAKDGGGRSTLVANLSKLVG
jgi:protein involved in temperature-dependent protein secretion